MSYLDERIKIDGIELYQVAIPLLVPFEISGGRSYNRQSIIIKMTSGDLVGYGESAPLTHRFTPARPSRRLRQCSMSGSYRRL